MAVLGSQGNEARPFAKARDQTSVRPKFLSHGRHSSYQNLHRTFSNVVHSFVVWGALLSNTSGFKG